MVSITFVFFHFIFVLGEGERVFFSFVFTTFGPDRLLAPFFNQAVFLP